MNVAETTADEGLLRAILVVTRVRYEHMSVREAVMMLLVGLLLLPVLLSCSAWLLKLDER